MDREQIRTDAAIEAIAYAAINGADWPKIGNEFEFDHRFGDEGPYSWTRCRVEVTAAMITAARETIARW